MQAYSIGCVIIVAQLIDEELTNNWRRLAIIESDLGDGRHHSLKVPVKENGGQRDRGIYYLPHKIF